MKFFILPSALTALLVLANGPSSRGVEAFVPHNLAFVTSRHQTISALDASTLERLPDSAVEVKLEIPGAATKAAYDKACNELSKKISIPGFRNGAKIPAAVLEQAMAQKGGRNALRVQAINALLAELVEPALKEEHGLEPVGQPVLTTPAEELAASGHFQPGDDVVLSVKCDVWPDIRWKKSGRTDGSSATDDQDSKPYIGLKGTYKRKPYDETKFNKALNDLRERYAILDPIDDPSYQLVMGNACVVNMEGFMANEAGEKGEKLPDAASGDRVEVILGDGRYMTGLVEGLVGAKVGETRTVTVTFPTVSVDVIFFGCQWKTDNT